MRKGSTSRALFKQGFWLRYLGKEVWPYLAADTKEAKIDEWDQLLDDGS